MEVVMRKTIIAGNWKMNKTSTETQMILSELKDLTKNIEGIEIVLGVPFTSLEKAVEVTKIQIYQYRLKICIPKSRERIQVKSLLLC